MESVLLGLATLSVIILGFSVVFLTLFWPSLLWILLTRSIVLQEFSLNRERILHDSSTPPGSFYNIHVPFLSAIILVQLAHIRFLWKDPHHLAIFRSYIFLPLRRLLVPIVVWVARVEGVRENAATLYWKTTPSTSSIMDNFRPSVRRHYRRMETLFRRANIRYKAISSESSYFDISQLLPILWEHERRVSPNNTVAEFLKRFLVVTLVPDGVVDLYFNDTKQLVAFQFSIQQQNVWHWFMYFCKDDYTKAGIWFHGSLLSIARCQMICNEAAASFKNRNSDITNLPGFLVNAQVHQDESKRFAGFESAAHTDSVMQAHLYPFCWSSTISENVAHMSLWR